MLGQVKADDKSNEISAVPELLDALLLKGCVVTLDAMGCQRKTAAKIVDAGADYVISLKGNQGTPLDEVSAFLEDAASRPQEPDRFETVEKGHGRVETRVCRQSGRLGWFADLDKRKGLKSVFKVGPGPAPRADASRLQSTTHFARRLRRLSQIRVF